LISRFGDIKMKSKVSFHHKLIVRSIATALGLTGASIATGQEASLEEIIVTSRQRAESSQDIPMMIQSLSGEDIQKQGIATLEDFSRFVGSLNVQSTTPGQNTIVFRGVSDGGGYLVDPTAAI
jgi:outer membrane receptor protein involved in Fe transport